MYIEELSTNYSKCFFMLIHAIYDLNLLGIMRDNISRDKLQCSTSPCRRLNHNILDTFGFSGDGCSMCCYNYTKKIEH